MADTGTVIGKKIRITGQVSGEEDLTVLGWVEGTITLGKTLHVEPSGVIKADVHVDTAVISGTVVGNITAKTAVELIEGGRMVGNINAPRVVIADGAAFRGYVDMGNVDAPEASTGRSVSARASRPARSTRGRSSRASSRSIPSEVKVAEVAVEAEVVTVSAAATKPKAKGARKGTGGKSRKKSTTATAES